MKQYTVLHVLKFTQKGRKKIKKMSKIYFKACILTQVIVCEALRKLRLELTIMQVVLKY